MQKNLVIVESPAKAKTIGKYLSKEFIVKSSVGHIRDLPKTASFKKNVDFLKKRSKLGKTEEKIWPNKNTQRLVRRMGIDPYHEWEAHYEIDPQKQHVVKELKLLAKQANFIYLATDLDREGEAIAWHLKEVLGGSDQRYRRVTFNAITRTSIQKAFEHPGVINIDHVNAQKTRRFLDRVVGFMLSPLLCKKVCKNLSAGRVQSPAVRLVVEKELLIKNFIPTARFAIIAFLGDSSGIFLPCELKKIDSKPFRCDSLEQALLLSTSLKNASFYIKTIEKKRKFLKPQPPFTTSTLQQAASVRMNFSVKRTMMIAQRLYEAGYITYMRTDSTQVSTEALNDVRSWIIAHYKQEYLPDSPYAYRSRAGAQEAHEAIRPTDLAISKEEIALKMDSSAANLYELVKKQFIASQMVAAEYDHQKISMVASLQPHCFMFQTTSQQLIFDGWTNLYTKKDTELNISNNWQPDQQLICKKLALKRLVTRPPARYSEASLVKELEKQGIGRPSTYASIIETIQKRGYVVLKNKRFYANKLGEITVNFLKERFDSIMSYDFTAQMERSLDEIAQGQKQWMEVLNKFFYPFADVVNQAKEDVEKGGQEEIKSLSLKDLSCMRCGREMLFHVNVFGPFLACSGYHNSENPCKFIVSLHSDTETSSESISTNEEILEPEVLAAPLEQEESTALDDMNEPSRCPNCNSALDDYIFDNTVQKLSLCGNYPKCQYYKINDIEKTVSLEACPDPICCDECQQPMLRKTGRFGGYMLCTKCKCTRKLLKNGDLAPKNPLKVDLPELLCQKQPSDHYILRQGSSGIFLAASTFPKVRESRAPTIGELKRFAHQMPKEWQIFSQAPEIDEEGNATLLRFHRKTKTQYVGSKKNGKWTKFIYEYPFVKTE